MAGHARVPSLVFVWSLFAQCGCTDLVKLTGFRLGHEQSASGGQNQAEGASNGSTFLGVVAPTLPIYESCDEESNRLGYLAVGSTVPGAQPATQPPCGPGWYSIAPRGFVAAEAKTTNNPEDPLLNAFGLAPELERDLPYTYAKTHQPTVTYQADPDVDQGVRPGGRLPAGSSFAVVGTWWGFDSNDRREKYAVLRKGDLVSAHDLLEVMPSMAQDAIGADSPPREGEEPNGVAATVSLARPPSSLASDQRWLDIDLGGGWVGLYQGQERKHLLRAVSIPKGLEVRGTTHVLAKHVTDMERDPRDYSPTREVRDVPWVVELASGLLLHAKWWDDPPAKPTSQARVGLSAADARRVWNWVLPELPKHWGGVRTQASSDATPVVLH